MRPSAWCTTRCNCRLERVRERLKLVLPLTLFLVFLLLHLNTKSVAKTMLILLAVPFSAVGAIWLLYVLGYNMSIGVSVGLIALMGVDAETGVFMLLYPDLAFDEWCAQGRHAQPARFAESHPARGGQTHPAQIYDGRHDVCGPGADHVVGRRGRRRDEAHRRAHDRRHLYFFHFGVGGLSGHL